MTFPTLPRDENTAHSYVSGLTSEQITDLILGCESAILAVEEFAELHNFRDDESYLSNA